MIVSDKKMMVTILSTKNRFRLNLRIRFSSDLGQGIQDDPIGDDDPEDITQSPTLNQLVGHRKTGYQDAVEQEGTDDHVRYFCLLGTGSPDQDGRHRPKRHLLRGIIQLHIAKAL